MLEIESTTVSPQVLVINLGKSNHDIKKLHYATNKIPKTKHTINTEMKPNKITIGN